MRNKSICALAIVYLLASPSCKSDEKVLAHPNVHGYFDVVSLRVNGARNAVKNARPWHYGYYLDSERAKQYIVAVDGIPILFSPTSYGHGMLIDLEIYTQQNDVPLMVNSVEIFKSSSDIPAEHPIRFTTMGSEGELSTPFPVSDLGSFRAVFDRKDNADSVYSFKITFMVGSEEIALDVEATRIGDKKGIVPGRLAPGGFWAWPRCVIGFE